MELPRLFPGLAVLAMAVLFPQAAAADPLDDSPVIGSLYAVQTDRARVTIRWVLDDISYLEHLNVYRGSTMDGPFEKLSEQDIEPCSPGVFIDDNIWDGQVFWYALMGLFIDGDEEVPLTHPACVTTGGSLDMCLDAPSPNPTRSEAFIHFVVPKASGSVSLGIFDVRGRLVCTLVDDDAEPGRQSRRWDCRDDDGRPVASGIYFVRYEVDVLSETRKLAVIR
jgi:hypothetical protein